MAAISAGSAVASSEIQANASKSAAATQAQAGQQALDTTKQQYGVAQSRLDAAAQTQRDIYNANQGNFAPYQALGAGAASTLGSIMGLPVAANTPAATTLPPINTSPTQGLVSPGFRSPSYSGTMIPATPGITQVAFPGQPPLPGQPPPGTFASGQPPVPRGTLSDAANLAAANSRSGYGGGTIMMRAPTGETGPVPMGLVQHYQEQGAQVVS